MPSKIKPQKPQTTRENKNYNLETPLEHFEIPKKSIYKVCKDKYIYIKERFKYYYLHETTINIRNYFSNLLFRMIVVSVAGFMILMVLRFVGVALSIMNYYSSIALYFIIQELPQYFKKFKKN